MVTVKVYKDIESVNVTTKEQEKEIVNAKDSTTVIYKNGGNYIFGNGLKVENYEESELVSVDVAERVEVDNTLPISSAAVYREVGNIDALLKTI